MEELKGYIDHITYQTEDGYTVMTIASADGSSTAVGPAKDYGSGETVVLEGDWVEHSIYGRQFKFSAIRAVPPSDRISMIRYLGSGAVKGIGEKMAVRIVDKFGDDTFRIMEEEPERLSEIKGISLRMAQELSGQLAGKRDRRNAMVWLQQYGISLTIADRIYEIYGTELYNVIKNNPYKLAEDVPAVGFKKADAIAVKAGISMDSEYRICSAVLYVLGGLSSEGHCFYPMDSLCPMVAKMLELDEELVREQLPQMAADHRVEIKNGPEGARVYSGGYYRAEKYCADKLISLRDAFPPAADEPCDWIAALEKELGLELDELQKKAVALSDNSGVLVLSGGPGTGKTTTINAIIRRLEDKGLSFMLAAPTGRAAKRMYEATGYEAKTIHRLLEMGAANDGMYYNRNEDEPLEADCIIIDEMSMVDIWLLKALLAAITPSCRLIMVGDVDQLPSVGPGQVLKDVMESGEFAVVRLQHIFRQAKDSHIIENAHKIDRGEHIDLSQKYEDFFLLEKDRPDVIREYLVRLISDVLPRRLSLSTGDIQVMTPMRKGVLGVESLNSMLQERLNPPAEDKAEVSYGDKVFRCGDKVMQIRNDYQLEWEICGDHNIVVASGMGVFNGDVGVIKQINAYLKLVEVSFDDGRVVYYPFGQLDELELAYAVTIHKSQGSEYPLVILPVLSGPEMLMSRNLLYTAVTRAKKCVILLGSGERIQQMIDNDHVQHRYTSLCERLQEAGRMADGS